MNIWRQILGLMACAGIAAAAQETKACAVLDAHISSVAAEVSQADPDTARIQQALNLCQPEMAVVLKTAGANNAFLSGPLIVPRGVTLWIAGGATLYASRNPRAYDLGSATRPFIFSYQAAFSGIGGPGTIDGRGVAPELVSSYESQGFHVEDVTLRNAARTNLAIYKTIGLRIADVRVQAPPDSGESAGILLSNAVDARIAGAWIRVPGEALSLKASILGGTSGVDVQGLHILGGRGIAIGDDVYGSVRTVTFDGVTIDGTRTGIAFNAKGTQGGQARDIHFRRGCLQRVGEPLRDLPEGHGIDFPEGPWDGKASCAVPAFPAVAKTIPLPEIAATGHEQAARQLTVGPGGLPTIQAAADALPAAGGEITVKPGTYREVVTIRKPHVHLHGEGDPAGTTIVYNHGPSFGGTFASATVFVEADDVTIDHLTISNDLGAGNGQGVALAVTADRAVFRNLRLLGAQDTLFAASRFCYGDYGPCVAARQYFADCYIEGNTDFIFGDSMAVFERCELHGIATGSVMYTAHSRHTEAQKDSGYVFDHCRLTGAPRQAAISLGRPWRPYATVVFLDALIEAPVIPAGWTEWPRFGQPSLPTAHYAEYKSTGPGANAAARESHSHQLSESEAAGWRANRFLSGADGWHPAGSR